MTAELDSTAHEQIIRPAGLVEKFSIHREHFGLYGPLVLAGTYENHGISEQSLTQDTLIKVLKQCIVEHSTLSVVVRDINTDCPQIARAPSIDLTRHFEILDPERFERGISQDLLGRIYNDFTLDFQYPQWRVYAAPSAPAPFQRFRLYFAFSHALTDARSGCFFHKTFLNALRNVQDLAHDSDPIYVPSNDLSLAPELEKTADFTISKEFLKTVLEPDASMPEIWCGDSANCKATASIPAPTAIEAFTLSKDVIDDALDACRKHASKLTGMFTQMAALAITRALRARGRHYEALAADTSFDMRRATHQGQASMANYASNTREIIATNYDTIDPYQEISMDDWEVIKRRTLTLGERATSLADHPVMLLKYLRTRNMRQWILDQAKGPGKSSFAICNVGVFDPETDATGTHDWTVNDLTFSQSSNFTTAPLILNFTSSKGGSTAVVVTWWPGSLGIDEERIFVKEICADITNQMETLSRFEKPRNATVELVSAFQKMAIRIPAHTDSSSSDDSTVKPLISFWEGLGKKAVPCVTSS